uniref:protein SUPPRESSOR OF MAX2 1-like n=1 Tax=Erigeron canadensis TaxID=72917 RepID=UPI001CB8C7B5|nr:protein SUPPRESSOR OF MAX2 1-like [Erigeron canadensis]
MRTGLNAILQTLTPEAATVFNHSIAEAGRRNHNQTTPLHVAATLLAAPTGFLRQACIRSHPNSSHPLQCRALELCFSVALERLPSNATSSPAALEPPVSNALMAALKRAQAHQRRGCSDQQQQQPLLTVKVELEHLIISILDDPSVSRVMREASFSSPAVKATIEQHSLANNVVFRPSLPAGTQSPVPNNRNLYMNQMLQRSDETSVSSMNLYLKNPRLQMGQKQGNLNLGFNQQVRVDDVKRVMDTMSKSNKKNPILVGEFGTEILKKEILKRIQSGDISTIHGFKNFDIVSVEFPAKIDELIDVIKARIRNGSDRGIVIDIGDLKWLIEQPATTEIGRESVAKIAKLVTKFGSENDKIWLIGTASCETYWKCQTYHPSLENDWDLQVVPISSTFSNRFGSNGMFGSSVESVNLFRNCDQMPPCCPKCFNEYEQELVKLNELEKSCVEAKSNLPQWLQDAKAQCGESESDSDTSMPNHSRVNDQQLLKKWTDICLRIHPNHDQSPNFARMLTGFVPMVPMVNAYKPNRLLGQSQTGQLQEMPRSPVHTELVLGSNEVHEDPSVKDFLGCISSEPQAKGKFANLEDADSFKKLLKALMKMAWWQPEAASTIAKIVTQCGSRGSMWWLFAGPDRAGKKKMASVLAQHVRGADPITICLGSRRGDNEVDTGYRGKTVLDRIVEAVRRNPFSVIVLSDIDEADMLVRGSIKQAMQRGRLTDSHGREISLGNIIFVLTGNWSTTNADDEVLDEKRLNLANVGGQLQLTVCEKRSKRRAEWLPGENMCTKQPRKVGSGLSLDLNLAMDVEEDRTDTSDLTIEQGDENPCFAIPSVSVPYELVGPSNEAVMFKPVQFGLIRREIEKTVKTVFSSIVDKKLSIEVDESTLDNISSVLWFGTTSLEDWAARVLVPSFHKLIEQLPSSFEDLVVRLESDQDPNLDQAHHCKDMLPSNIKVVIDTV